LSSESESILDTDNRLDTYYSGGANRCLIAIVTSTWFRHDYVPELPRRLKRFLWLSSGMFSAAALAVAFLGYYYVGSFQEASSNFIASIASGGIFWASDSLKFGPSSA